MLQLLLLAVYLCGKERRPPVSVPAPGRQAALYDAISTAAGLDDVQIIVYHISDMVGALCAGSVAFEYEIALFDVVFLYQRTHTHKPVGVFIAGQYAVKIVQPVHTQTGAVESAQRPFTACGNRSAIGFQRVCPVYTGFLFAYPLFIYNRIGLPLCAPDINAVIFNLCFKIVYKVR